MSFSSKSTLEQAAAIVQTVIPPTPQFSWPLLSKSLGAEVWVKHENHTCVGAFKVRGGVVFFDDLKGGKKVPGVISATRGNHGQSVGLNAKRAGIACTIVVPYGNSKGKNAAMRALGVDLIEHGDDFQAAREHAEALSTERQLIMVPSFHPLLVRGVASYCMEFLSAVPDLHKVYVPIGLGSGICAMVAARNALGLKTEIIGVVSSHATAYADSFRERCYRESPVSTAIADGMACSTPVAEALDIIWREVSRIVEVSDDEVMSAMQLLFECTHNVSEGAGAASAAAAMQDAFRNQGQRIGVVLTGGNVDTDVFSEVLRFGR